MKKVKLGKTDLSVSPICFGTLWIGGIDEDSAIRTIARGCELGINFIDTAEGYGRGRSESIVGKAIKGRRDDVVIATKCGLWWGQFEDKVERPREHHVNMMGIRSETQFRNSRPDYIGMAIDESLKRLGTDYIDLYQIHYPDHETPWEDTIGALEKAREKGKIRYYGVSNFTKEEMVEWMNTGPLHSVQPIYNMFSREIENDILPLCRERDVAVLPYSTLAHGLLTGKFTADWEFGEGDFRPRTRFFEGDAFAQNLAKVVRLKAIAADKGVSMAQFAIAWVLAQPGITSALCSAKNRAQVEDNAGATECKLTTDDVNRVDAILQ